MIVTDASIRAMLDARGRRLRPESVAEAARRATATANVKPRRPVSARAQVAAALVVATVVGVASMFVLLQARPGSSPATGSPALFQPGIYQSSRALGGKGVMERLCVAIALDDGYASATSVRAWWWSAAVSDCRQAASGVTPATPTLTPVKLPAGGSLPERTAYLVRFDLQLLPADTQGIAFTLDPAVRSSQSDPVPARIGSSSVLSVDFGLVPALHVEVPGGPHPATPQIAPAPTP